MVSYRIWRLAFVGLVLCWPAVAAKAADKSDPKECERKAKAALALAATALPATVAVAPAPREKTCDGRCTCPDCQCRPDACPAPKAIPAAQPVVPQPMPAAGRREFWQGVGWVEYRSGSWWKLDCPNGNCPVPR